MAPRHVVVDGSNIATEGRSMPSLAQLDQAVREFLTENPTDIVTVVVDASFGHRIDASELDLFEGAEEAGELVSPPAGAIGRGDAFLLRIADKTGATVLSNDSFQEFHGDYEWLFERGRLIGGKPVPGVGWIFTPRTPVRGPRSREAVQEAKRKKRGEGAESSMPGLDLAAERARAKGRGKGKKTVERAIAVALEEVVAPKAKPRRRRSGSAPPAEAVNDPLAFITFIAAHPLGTEVTATVESFASHGAFVEVEGARCYVPLSAMGDPPPKSAREVFAKGETATFVIQALDPQRRGIELALPSFVKVAGAPTAETVAAEIESQSDEPAEWGEPESGAATDAEPVPAPAPARRSRKKAAPPVATATEEPAGEPASAIEAPVKKSRGRRVAPPAEPAAAAATPPAPRKRAPAKRAQAAAPAAGEKAPARKRSPAAAKAATAGTPGGEQPAPAQSEVTQSEVTQTEVAPAPAPAGPKRAAAKRAKRAGPVGEPPAVEEPAATPRRRAAAKKTSAVPAAPIEPAASPDEVSVGQDESETPERTAVRTRAASRKARSEAAADDESDLAYRSAGRKRAPVAKSPSGSGRRGGGTQAAAPTPPPAPEEPPVSPAPARRRRAATPAEPSPAAPASAGTETAAEPAKAQSAKRAPRTRKATAAGGQATPGVPPAGAADPPQPQAQAQPSAAAAKPGRRRSGRVASSDATQTPTPT